MGVVRIQAIGPGAVEYLLHGCDPKEPQVEASTELEPGQEAEGPEMGPGREQQAESGVGYFLDGRGEPAGVWIGSGMASLGFSYQAGDTANENDLRAIFGELRYPGSQWQGSTKENPEYLRGKPRNYRTLAERVEAALKAEPEASPERQREIEVETARNTKSNTAYYDVTFSPVKSVSVYYAALLAAGEHELAQQIRAAHDQAVRIAIESAQDDVAWAKTGRHGRASTSGRTTGRWEKARGLSAVLFAHHTNRDGEPQLHAHVGVLNVVATGDGRHYALDGAAFRPVKDAMGAAYDRAMEAIISELTGVVWVERVDGHGREIAGMDPELMEDASTRSRQHVEPRIAELVGVYVERHGHEPGPQARRKIVDQAVKDTRRPKTGPAGPAAVRAWTEGEAGRAQRLRESLDEIDAAVVSAAANGASEPISTGYVIDGKVVAGPELATDVQLPEQGVVDGQPGVASGQQSEGDGHSPVASGHPGVSGHGSMATGHQSVAIGEQSMVVGQPGAAGGQRVSDAARAELGVRAVAIGLERVQAKYPTWQIGALVREIDDALGCDAGAVGLGLDARRQWVRGLAEAVLTPRGDGVVVQVSMGDPVPIAPQMAREVDGRSMLRAPIDERYVTASHLSLEQRLVATAQTPTAPALDVERAGRVADEARRAGLSGDQVAAVAAILGSPRQVDVLVGPAGAGKSHTLAQVASAWQAEHGGRVIGTSTGEKATRNLTELGMQARNVRWLLSRLDPNEQGRVRMTLRGNDLLVIDEAGMASTTDLERLTAHAARAGAKVIWAGDHHQLPSVEAGGVFAYLAEQPGAVELETVHRFSNEWERDASLRLRAGDAAVAPVYADEGRLRAGTLEQVEYLAASDYVADRLAGHSALLIVGSNARAAQLSNDIQEQLTELGVVRGPDLLEASDRNKVRIGDLIQALEGNANLWIEGPRDEHGRRRPTLPVANRQVFTVIGFDSDSKTIFARDEHGAVAQLPEWYVKGHVALAYAVTNHAAQGVTVDRARALVERGMSASALYPASTRGRALNLLYLVTETAPDPHAPQRERDTAVSALVAVLENDSGKRADAALTVQAAAALEARSMLTLTEHYDRMATEQVHRRHAALAVSMFGPDIENDRAFGALLGRMRAVELEGHDITAIFAQADAMSGFGDAREVSKVMWWRLGKLQERRVPESSREQVLEGQATVRPAWEQLAVQHRERFERTGDNQEAYLATVAEYARERTAALGAQVAAAPTEWALEWLGPMPDPTADPAGYAVWVSGAGQVAAYREWRGIPDEQISIGSAPPPSQQLAHELWRRAAETGSGDPRVVDWRQASDAELRAAVRRWDLRLQWAPPAVAAERGEALALAHDAGNDVTVGRARLAVMAPDDPERAGLLERVHGDEVMAEQAHGFAASLEQAHATREAWWEASRDVREAARGAGHELDRRGLPHREPKPDETPNPQSGQIDETTAPAARAAAAPAAPEVPLRAEQQVLDLHLDPEGPAEPGSADESTPNEQFLARLAAEHQAALEQADPAGQMRPVEREAAVHAANFETFISELRRDHGARLDPDSVLGDLELAHVRARELAAERGETVPVGVETNDPATPGAPPVSGEPRMPESEPGQPDTTEPGLAEPQPSAATIDEPRFAEPAAEREPAAEPIAEQTEPAVEPGAAEPAETEAAAVVEPGGIEDGSIEPAAALGDLDLDLDAAPATWTAPQTETAPEPAMGQPEPAAEAEPETGRDTETPAARLRRVAREVRVTRIEREVDAAHEARQAEQAAGADSSPRERAAEREQEATLHDELAAHRDAARAGQAELQHSRELERGHDPEID